MATPLKNVERIGREQFGGEANATAAQKSAERIGENGVSGFAVTAASESV